MADDALRGPMLMNRSPLGWLNLVTVSLWLWTLIATVAFAAHLVSYAAVTIFLTAAVIASATCLFFVVEVVEARKRR